MRFYKNRMDIKILLIHIYFEPAGGAEVIAYDSMKLLQKYGHNVRFLALKGDNYFDKKYPYINDFTTGVKSTKDYLKSPLSYYYNFKAQRDVNKVIKEFKPDLIHLHNIISGFSPAILKCCKDYPTVMTVHDVGIACPATTLMLRNEKFCMTQKCRNGNGINCILNKCEKNSLEGSIRKAIRYFIIHNNIKYIDHFITPSQTLKQHILLCNTKINANQISVVNNFLPDEAITAQPSFNNTGYFLYIGRLAKPKGVHYLLEAMKDLPKDIKLHIVGTGKEEQALKEYAKEHNLDNVEFLGFKNREEIKEEYQNCIATILPSNCFENFPTTNMESFINGKPVIASNIGGIPEQVEHNKTGLLFEPGNVEQLKECILKYWDSPKLVVEHGVNAYSKAVNLYSTSNYYKSIMNIYRTLLQETEGVL